VAGSVCLLTVRGMITLIENACFYFLLSFMFSLVLSISVAKWQNLLFVLWKQNPTQVVSVQLDVLLRFCDLQLFLLGLYVGVQFRGLKFCLSIMDKDPRFVPINIFYRTSSSCIDCSAVTFLISISSTVIMQGTDLDIYVTLTHLLLECSEPTCVVSFHICSVITHRSDVLTVEK